MIYDALIVDIDEYIEEEVLVEIDGVQITAFASYWPDPMCKGGKYQVEISFLEPDNIEIKEINNPCKELEKIGDSYAHWVRGYFSNGTIDCGIRFEDEDNYLLLNYGYLDGKFIEMKVDRIDLSLVSAMKGL